MGPGILHLFVRCADSVDLVRFRGTTKSPVARIYEQGLHDDDDWIIGSKLTEDTEFFFGSVIVFIVCLFFSRRATGEPVPAPDRDPPRRAPPRHGGAASLHVQRRGRTSYPHLLLLLLLPHAGYVRIIRPVDIPIWVAQQSFRYLFPHFGSFRSSPFNRGSAQQRLHLGFHWFIGMVDCVFLVIVNEILLA